MDSMARPFVFLAISGMLMGLSMAATYNVGGSNGWDTTTNLQAWTSSQTFTVGDTIVFQYTSNHDVTEVSQLSDYDNCVASSPMMTYTDGNTSVDLTSPGTRYFICATPGHCGQGMKVQVDVLASSAPPTPTSPPASPGTPASPPPPPGSSPPQTTVSPPPPPPSSSSGWKCSFALGFGFALMILLAF